MPPGSRREITWPHRLPEKDDTDRSEPAAGNVPAEQSYIRWPDQVWQAHAPWFRRDAKVCFLSRRRCRQR